MTFLIIFSNNFNQRERFGGSHESPKDETPDFQIVF